MQSLQARRHHSFTQTQRLVSIPLLASVAFLLQFLEVPLPFFYSFLKLDVSNLPGLLGGLVFGPVTGVIIELLKNTLHAMIKHSEVPLVGELANFIAGAAFIYTTVSIYRITKNGKGLIAGFAFGTIAMTLMMSVANYFFIMPAYAALNNVNMDQLLKLFHLQSLWSFVVYTIIPFNVVKGAVVSVVAYPIITKIAPRLKVPM